MRYNKMSMAKLAICALALALLPAGGVRAQGALKVGYVDMDALTETYTKYKENNDAFTKFVQHRQDTLQQRVMLTEIEWQELDGLQAMDPAKETADQKKRQTELEGLSEQRDKELRDLQGISEPTDEQRRRRQDLEQIARANRKRIQDLDAKLSDEVQKKKFDLLKELNDQIHGAVTAVAKKKNLVLVIEKSLVLYAEDSLDITKDVAAQLNAAPAAKH